MVAPIYGVLERESWTLVALTAPTSATGFRAANNLWQAAQRPIQLPLERQKC